MRIDRIIIGALAPLAGALLFAPGQVAAQAQSASAAAMLEEIIVTARRREENLMELPLSVQAITSDAMQAQGIYNLQQITDFVPNVVLTEDQRKNDTRLFIRGVGGGFSNPAQVFGVGTYIDGHYISGSLGAFLSTTDVERVEVLRGPQGTLFGKNTTGGAISMVSQKPGPEFDSYVTLRAADFGETGIRAMINVPITDNLFFRGNIASEKNDGFYFNRFLGEDTGGSDQQSVGLALRWQVSDTWMIDAKLLASYDRDDNQGGACLARPDQEMYDLLVRNVDRDGDPLNDGPAFTGPDLVLGTADDVIYTGPGPFPVFGSDPWGSRNDDTALRTPTQGGILGGSDFRVDALYPGANAVWLMECVVSENSGIYSTYQDANTYSDVDNEMFMLDATWNSDGAAGPFEAASVQIKGAWRYSSYNYYQDRDFGPGIIDHIGNNPTGSRGIARYTDEIEVIFNGQIGDSINLTAGFYWFDDEAGSGNGTCVDDWWAAFDPNGVNSFPVDPGADGILGTGDDFVQVGTINGMDDDDIICIPDGGTFFHRLPDTAGDRRAFFNHGQTTGESTAVYAHVDWSINEQWNLAFGARVMEDKRTGRNAEPGRGSVVGCTNVGNPLNMCDGATYVLNRDNHINGGFMFNASETYDEVTPMISLTRHLAPGNTIDSGIIYGTISEGYLHGAFNDELNAFNGVDFSVDGRALVQSLVTYGPEFVTNYEVGFKSTLADGAVRIAAAIFFMDYTDKQEAIEVDNADGQLGPDPNLEYTQNASSVDIKGIELELRASPWDGGFLSLDVGWLDMEYADFQYTDLRTGDLVTPALNQIANRTPDWTVTASVEHAFQLGNGGILTPQLGLYMQDEMEWWRGGNVAPGVESRDCHQDSFTKWRVRVAYEPQASNWQAALYGYNITDEEILFRCQEIRSGTVGRWFEAPSQWGAEFTMRFGGS